jgi:hypothetical protein
VALAESIVRGRRMSTLPLQAAQERPCRKDRIGLMADMRSFKQVAKINHILEDVPGKPLGRRALTCRTKYSSAVMGRG